MANYPQLDDCSGVWTLKEVNDAIMGGYWRQAGTRGIFGGGYNHPALVAAADFVTIATTGNASAFGNLSVSRRHLTAFSSFNRNFFAGGATPSMVNHIDYFTPSSQGNASDFGDLTNARKAIGASANTT